MEAKGKKDSDFKYIGGEAFKEKFTDILVPNSTESKFVQCNGFFTAIPWKAKGGGQLAVKKVDDYTKFGINDPMIKGHSGPITDFQFNPFIDNFLATASEDGTVALWTIPLDGITEDMKTPNATLYGHSKKLTHLGFNPSAENVLATAAFDKEVRIWDAYHAKETLSITGLIGQPTCMEWNHDGSLLAITDKNKDLHVLDPRDTSGAGLANLAHDGPKQIKCCWLGESNRIITTGVSKSMYKEMAIWDSRDLTKAVYRKKGEKNMEVSDPFFDPINNLIYLAVKGEARVNIWELSEGDEMLDLVGSFKGEGSHRGFNFLPKRFVDVMSSEVMRGVRLTDRTCEYVSFGLPKKRGAFVSSLYGKCPNGDFAKTFDQWKDGESAPPPMVEMSPDIASTHKLRSHDGSFPTSSNEGGQSNEINVVNVSTSSSAAVGSTALNRQGEDVEEVKKKYERKITELEEQLSAQASSETPNEAPASSTNEDSEKLRNENNELTQKLAGMQDKVSELERFLILKDAEIEELKREIGERPTMDITKGLEHLPPLDSTWEERNVLGDGHFFATMKKDD